jgi:hypothetical protein
MATLAELEEQYDRLQREHMDAEVMASRIAKEHGLTQEQTFLLPTLPYELLDDESMRGFQAECQERKGSLPPEVRAALIRAGELSEVVSEMQQNLAPAMLADGKTMEQIAERLNLPVGTVRAIIQVTGG